MQGPSFETALSFFGGDHDQHIHDAQKQATYRPDENATDRARLDNADTRVANDAGGGKGNGALATEATNKDRSGPRREGENNAAELVAETAGSPEWANPPCRQNWLGRVLTKHAVRHVRSFPKS
jgi:hypothetical protein